MNDNLKKLKQELSKVYDYNSFVRLLQIFIIDADEGQSILSMPVDPAIHTNLYKIAHGGALASLADTCMGIACVTLGKRVVTLEMNINFVKGAEPQQEIKAIGKVIHNGSKTMVAEAEIVNGSEDLLAKARGTFFVIGRFGDEKNA